MPRHRAKSVAQKGQLQRRRDALRQKVRDRLSDLVRDAELEPRRLAGVAAELHENRIVQAERTPDRCALGRRGVDADHLVDRVARKPDHRECDQPDGQKNAHGLERARDDEGEHGGSCEAERARRLDLSGKPERRFHSILTQWSRI